MVREKTSAFEKVRVKLGTFSYGTLKMMVRGRSSSREVGATTSDLAFKS